MKKKIDVKNIIIVVLCITIIAMGIGFIVLSLGMEGLKNGEKKFDVRFSSFHKLSSIKGGVENPSGAFEIKNSGKVLDMNFLLYQEHDEVDYEVVVRNAGDMKAKIISLFASPDFSNSEVAKEILPVSIQISDISGKILDPGEETTIKISAFYHPGTNLKTSKFIQVSGQLGILAESKN